MNIFSNFPRKDTILAFGAELSTCKYRLTLARYPAMADFIRREARTKKKALKLLDVTR